MAEIPGREREKMSAAGLHFFHGIGLDPSSTTDQRRIREALRWVETEQEAQARRKADEEQSRRDRLSRFWVFGMGIASMIAGSAIAWFSKHFGG